MRRPPTSSRSSGFTLAEAAITIAIVGIGLLLALARPRSAGQVYAFRMIGIMALAGGVVLAMRNDE